MESKLPDTLQLWYVTVRPEEKLAALLVLLKTYIDQKQQTLVFAATKHHVEYLHKVLNLLLMYRDCVVINVFYLDFGSCWN